MSKLAGIVLTVFAANIAAVALVHAQTFPDHPIKVIVAYPAGGPTDTVARLATQNIAEQLGQGMIIENVAGAGGRIGTRDVARASPDGYTLLLGGTNDNAIAPVLYKSLDYDPAKDFVPVSAWRRTPMRSSCTRRCRCIRSRSSRAIPRPIPASSRRARRKASRRI